MNQNANARVPKFSGMLRILFEIFLSVTLLAVLSISPRLVNAEGLPDPEAEDPVLPDAPDMGLAEDKSKGVVAEADAQSALTSSATAPYQLPLYLITSADPNVLFNMSIETPMGGAAYNDEKGMKVGDTTCGGRSGSYGTCYFPNSTYLGYFDPDKCYKYDGGGGYFYPVSATGTSDGKAHTCSGAYSGNMMNWATMTAMDMFTWTMTGGNRTTDTIDKTVIKRMRKTDNNSWFPIKRLKSSLNISPSLVTPFGDSSIYVSNGGFTVSFGSSSDSLANKAGPLNVSIRACDPAAYTGATVATNCKKYTKTSGSTVITYYKPEGLIQKNSSRMRFAVSSFLKDDSQGRDGGVLRTNMKYVGPKQPDDEGNLIDNKYAEFGADGIHIVNPDNVGRTRDSSVESAVDTDTGGVRDSGVINFINGFSDDGYKGLDPASELFYESVEFFRHRNSSGGGTSSPTPEYIKDADIYTSIKAGFPVLKSWKDPIEENFYCRKNFIIGINDANPWLDKKLPGTAFTSATYGGRTLLASDFGEPTNADPDINVKTLTDEVGTQQGLNGTATVASQNTSDGSDKCTIGCTESDCDLSGRDLKTITTLGSVMGTCPYEPKENSYYIAGLAYYANSRDIRADREGRQIVNTFMIDTQEYSTSPLTGQMNMLWLAGKFGGYVDQPSEADLKSSSYISKPNITSEWDKNADGEPDNYVLATQPDKLVAALSRAFTDIDSRSSSSSSVVANSAQLDTGSVVFQAKFNSKDWSGHLLAYRVNADDATIIREKPGDFDNSNWDANSKLPTASARSIYYDAGTTSAAFTDTNMNGTASIWKELLTKDEINFLRGDQSKEVPTGSFRSRVDSSNTSKNNLLGDIVNSDPWYIGKEDQGFGSIKDPNSTDPSAPMNIEGTSYGTYQSTKASRVPMILAGANDGMLHVFNASLTEDDSNGGKELVAFIPSAVMTNLKGLTSTDYVNSHKFFVDGPAVASDAYIEPKSGGGKTWRTVAVGTTGGGGRAVFGLDLTLPNTFDITSPMLWDIGVWPSTATTDPCGGTSGMTGLAFKSGSIDDLCDKTEGSPKRYGFLNYLGYTLSQAIIARMANGEWAAIVANGYDSVKNQAVLYILNASTGQIIRSINTGAGDSTNKNGLSGPAAIDEDNDYIVDTIYAGDLLGNLWKFDVSSSDPNDWAVAFSGDPFFAATDRFGAKQAITAEPKLALLNKGEQKMIFFGTGSYYLLSDRKSKTEQTFYGLWDNGNKIDSRSLLQQQNILASETINNIDLRGISDNEVDYKSDNPKRGWYIDLIPFSGTAEGERIVNEPILLDDRILFISAIPSVEPCAFGGSSYFYELQAISGAPLPNSGPSPWDIGGGSDGKSDGKFDKNDYMSTGDNPGARKLDLTNNPGMITTKGGITRKYFSYQNATLDDSIVEKHGGGEEKPTKKGRTGRVSWRQLR